MHESQSFWAPLLDCSQYTIVLAKVIIAKSEGRVKGESRGNQGWRKKVKLRITKSKPINKLTRPESWPNRCWVEEGWSVTVSKLEKKFIFFTSIKYATISKRIPEKRYDRGSEITFWARSKKIPMKRTTKPYLRKVFFDMLKSLPFYW